MFLLSGLIHLKSEVLISKILTPSPTKWSQAGKSTGVGYALLQEV